MTDLDKLIHILTTLNIEYADYSRPDGRGEVQICDHDFKSIGVVYFDADGNFDSCGVSIDCY